MDIDTGRPVLFVGAGPGDPDLITVAGRRALEQADLVVYAGSLVSPLLLDCAPPTAERVDSAPLDLKQITDRLIDGWREGKRVVRLQIGDPSLYGALREQTQALNAASVPWRVVPGVTAAFAAAAMLGHTFTLPEVTQSLVLTRPPGRTPTPAAEDIASLAAHGCSVAIYLGAELADKISDALGEALGPDAPVVAVHRATWPEQMIVRTTAAALPQALVEAGLTRQTIVLAGPTVAALGHDDPYPASRLYAADFEHGFRKAPADAD